MNGFTPARRPPRSLQCSSSRSRASLGASSARADVPGPITTRVMTILNAAGSGTTGMYVKEVGGPVLAAQNENFAFGPASSIKVLLHLYIHDQVEAGAAAFTDDVTLYGGGPGSCPNGAAVLGTEDLDDSAAKMMKRLRQSGDTCPVRALAARSRDDQRVRDRAGARRDAVPELHRL